VLALQKMRTLCCFASHMPFFAIATARLAKSFGFFSDVNVALQRLQDRVQTLILICRPVKSYFVFDLLLTRLKDHDVVGSAALVASRFAVRQ
jgi:hypothetical protein